MKTLRSLIAAVAVIALVGIPMARAQDIPQKVTDPKGYGGAGGLPIDGKPHCRSVAGYDMLASHVMVNLLHPLGAVDEIGRFGQYPREREVVAGGGVTYFHPLGAIGEIGWFGQYPREREVVAGKAYAAVWGQKIDKIIYTGVSVPRQACLYLHVEEPKTNVGKIGKFGTVSFKVTDASMLAQHMGAAVQVAKAWNEEKLDASAYPRRSEVGKLTDIKGYTLTLYVDQQSPTTPAEVNFKSTDNNIDNNILVHTARLADVDVLRRQVRRVAAWLENRPYQP